MQSNKQFNMLCLCLSFKGYLWLALSVINLAYHSECVHVTPYIYTRCLYAHFFLQGANDIHNASDEHEIGHCYFTHQCILTWACLPALSLNS